jgi:hypothetical protein
MVIHNKTGSLLGSLAGRLLALFGKSPARTSARDLRRMDFRTSTQRLGIRFTEGIRRVFRFKWIKAYKKTDTHSGCRSEQREEPHQPE